MIPQACITAWRAQAPWPDDAQVEQDLALSRSMVELFSDNELKESLAMRGGTALNKLFIASPKRYSEDIDLVQMRAGPIGSVIGGIRSKLDPWLGAPRRSRSRGSVTLLYRFQSEIEPIRPLRLKVEINTREHFTVLGLQQKKMGVTNPWFTGKADVTTYALDELLGTKLRALYQRKKSRDLFDLWLCLEEQPVNPNEIVKCFLHYMKSEGHSVSRAKFEENLANKAADTGFMGDISPLLAADVAYDSHAGLEKVQKMLIECLPGELWKGKSGSA